MKRVLICAAIIAAMTAAGMMLEANTEDTAENVSARLSELPAIKDGRERTREAERVLEDWEDFCADNIFLTNNEGAFEVTVSLTKIAARARTDGDISEECAQAELLLRSYTRSRRLSLNNIF